MWVLVTLRRKVLDVLSWKVFNIRRVSQRDQRNDGRIRGKLGEDDTIIFWIQL